MPERSPVGFGRRSTDHTPASSPGETPFPAGATRLDDDLVASLLPERPARGHKGSFGRLLVIAGSLNYAGAAFLVCRAAGRAGAGLVTLAVPESLQPLFAAKVVETTTMALPEDDVEEIDPEAAMARILDHEHDALVVGPGLRPGLATTELVRQLLPRSGEADVAPIILDAEALRSLATMEEWWQGDRRPSVLTPHTGEFARLRAGSGRTAEEDGDLVADDEARLAAAVSAATTWGSVVVLKGARTIIADPDGSAAIAPFENPALATGGTGDVLAGAIGSLLAQGLAPFSAARIGVYLHGVAGEAGRERFGDAGLLASDLPEGLAIARKRLVASAERRAPGRQLGFTARASAAEAEPPPDVGPVEPAVGEPLPDELAAVEANPLEGAAENAEPTEAPEATDAAEAGEAADPSQSGQRRPVDGGQTGPSSTDAPSADVDEPGVG
jgi:NAD(P)H-hydrate epimerase